ncbi:MAG: prepilin-type N-terminal cleavage/methylation domain-containing protein [Planctomycetota bacterium]|nr:prepilin-type N-terminal cleavage/methylation domain-containing protein [Planctomycetota bacterium]
MIRQPPIVSADSHRPGLSCGRGPLRRAVTLIEVLLVLSILVSLAALSYPSVDRMLDQLAMDGAVSPVRNHLAGTRIRALDAGLTWQFRIEPGGRRYVAVPYEFDEIDEIEGDDQEQQSQLELLPRVSGQLPEGFSFSPVDEMTADVEALDERAVAGLAELTKLQETVWAAPLLFYSDGTSRTASFDIVDEKLRSRRLSVRALTGGVTISDPNQEVRR